MYITDILTLIMFKTKKQTFELIQNGTIINVSVMNNDEVHKEEVHGSPEY